jgi:hypothetical protein
VPKYPEGVLGHVWIRSKFPFRPTPLPGSLIEGLAGEEKGAVWGGSGSWPTEWRKGDGEPPMDDGDDCGEGTAGSSDWDTRKGPCKPSDVGTRKGLLAYVDGKAKEGAKTRKIARLQKEGKEAEAAAENAVDVSNKRVLEERLAKQRKMDKDESAHAAANQKRKYSARWGAPCKKKSGLDYRARGQAGRLEVYLISWLLILLWHGIN